MTTLFLATRNAHKLDEIAAILGNGYVYRTPKEYPSAPEVAEDADTFAGNAILKAVALARWLVSNSKANVRMPDSRSFVVADDSGLEVDALGGAPGVHSARFAALDRGGHGNATDGENSAKLLRLLKDLPLEKRTARFRCVIALAQIPEAPAPCLLPACAGDESALDAELFEGACEGRIGFEARGQNGFGYDPLFSPQGYDQTFAELGDAVKGRISHRAKALARLKARLESSGPAWAI